MREEMPLTPNQTFSFILEWHKDGILPDDPASNTRIVMVNQGHCQH